VAGIVAGIAWTAVVGTWRRNRRQARRAEKFRQMTSSDELGWLEGLRAEEALQRIWTGPGPRPRSLAFAVRVGPFPSVESLLEEQRQRAEWAFESLRTHAVVLDAYLSDDESAFVLACMAQQLSAATRVRVSMQKHLEELLADSQL
jgi:hypothetical protein